MHLTLMYVLWECTVMPPMFLSSIIFISYYTLYTRYKNNNMQDKMVTFPYLVYVSDKFDNCGNNLMIIKLKSNTIIENVRYNERSTILRLIYCFKLYHCMQAIGKFQKAKIHIRDIIKHNMPFRFANHKLSATDR